MDWLAVIGLVVSGFGLVGVAVGLWQAGKQIKRSRKVALGEFLLNLDERFTQHQEVNVALRPGGKWASGSEGPETAEEWSQVEIYMGLFERINILIEKDILDADTVDRLYGYRVKNIVNNLVIRDKKLVKESKYWTDFLSLCEKLKIRV